MLGPFSLFRGLAPLALAAALCACSGEPADAPHHGPADAAADADADAGKAYGPGCFRGQFSVYRGNLHAHTSYSDGKLTPADSFAYARDSGKLDLQIVTDHLEQLYGAAPPADDLSKCRAEADAAYVAGTFVAACGYEYGTGFGGNGSAGHNNVFFVDHLFPQLQFNFHDFYKSLDECPDCIGQFNHPGDGGQTYVWNGYEYFASTDEKMNLFELSGDGPDAFAELFRALDAGWHVSPVQNQDNHDTDWGTKNADRSGFWLGELTREALRDAMSQRRSFSSRDRNAAIHLLADGECWMGSLLSGYSSLTLSVSATDEDAADGFEKIEWFGPGKTVIDTEPCGGATCDAALELSVTKPSYVLARATQVDGDVLVSAPIWVAP